MIPALQAPVFGSEVQERLLTEFRRAAAHVPGYRILLDEHGVRVDEIRDVRTFCRCARCYPEGTRSTGSRWRN